MGRSSTPTRLDADVHAAAKVAAELTGRSVADQLSHWATVGAQVEAAALRDAHVRRGTAADVLRGRDYDELPADERSLVRALWEENTDRVAAATSIADDKAAAGKPVVTIDEDGNVVHRMPDGSVQPA